MIERERGRDPGRGRSRLHAGSPTWGSIPGPGVTPWAEGGAKLLSAWTSQDLSTCRVVSFHSLGPQTS